MREDDVAALQERLRICTRIVFNEPHFTQQLSLRGGDREFVLAQLRDPARLVYSYHETGKRGDTKHVLHFEMSNTRMMILPVILQGETIYVLTYIMRYRKWRR